jgi:hypothetical protein
MGSCLRTVTRGPQKFAEITAIHHAHQLMSDVGENFALFYFKLLWQLPHQEVGHIMSVFEMRDWIPVRLLRISLKSTSFETLLAAFD